MNEVESGPRKRSMSVIKMAVLGIFALLGYFVIAFSLDEPIFMLIILGVVIAGVTIYLFQPR